MKPFRFVHALATALALTTTAASAEMVKHTTQESFDDVIFGLENAILDEGLVIDSISHIGEMLERTRQDVGSDIELFTEAKSYSFCSASLSREVMEADPMNISFCPYTIFVAVLPDAPDETMIGYRSFPQGAMQKVEALLDGIVKSAIGE